MQPKNRRPRYVVREVEGALSSGLGPHAGRGLSVSVHDSWNSYRTRAVYRTEDHAGTRPVALRERIVRAHARAMADTLEDWNVS
jgi:hypothetical protein